MQALRAPSATSPGGQGAIQALKILVVETYLRLCEPSNLRYGRRDTILRVGDRTRDLLRVGDRTRDPLRVVPPFKS